MYTTYDEDTIRYQNACQSLGTFYFGLNDHIYVGTIHSAKKNCEGIKTVFFGYGFQLTLRHMSGSEIEICKSLVLKYQQNLRQAIDGPQVRYLQLAPYLCFKNKNNKWNRISSWTLSPVDLKIMGTAGIWRD